MIATNDGYSLIYNRNKNTILINLPQTFVTMRDTVSPIGNRRTEISEGEEAVILGIVRKIFNVEETNNE